MSILHYFVRMNEHALLLEAMVAKLDLTKHMHGSSGPGSDMRQAANRCLACNRSMDCAEWLADAESPSRAPRFCRNHALFTRLASEAGTDQNSP